MPPIISSDNYSVESKALGTRMMEANEYSDFVIKCHPKTFHVHRIVVCTQSKPIQAAANGKFLESVTGVLDLVDDNPNTVARMINFFYLRDYDDSETTEEAKESYGRLLINTMVYIIGDKYDIQGLKTLAKRKYEAAIDTEWNTPSFSASLELMYEELPESDTCLTSLALQTASKHVKELKDKEEFASLCKNNPAIAYDLFTTAASQSPATIPEPKVHMETRDHCPKGHSFTHLKDIHAMYDSNLGKWKVKCPNCAMQKVCYKADGSCDLEAKWDGVGVGYWYL
ncbi:b6a0de1f-0760-4072-9c36-5fc5038b03e6 [Sclerotinia trifoliorum]|uniref:B6a0de1f-0760-4072-9c36-5fc5038b03e6 n=1 Tax=Sclerotinia trifoliorum TaxID=28548 RepID=A0A8H2W5S1_9HELO|nr:b6a0de1f-0760-4072-9c36-5fc5038b03e6 [Sclerotinia trifoliorum]